MNGSQHSMRAGVDPQTDVCVWAIENGDSITLTRSPHGKTPDLPWEEDQTTSLVFALPDHLVTVKALRVYDSAVDIRERARCELASSLLDDSELFSCELVSTNQPNWLLGLAVRRELEQNALECIPERLISGRSNIKGRMRARALAEGFVRYGSPKASGLHCLLAPASCGVSIGLVSDDHIVDLSHLSIPDRFAENGERATGQFTKQIVSELGTLIGYRIKRLTERGLHEELSTLIWCGEADADAGDSDNPRASVAISHLSDIIGCLVTPARLRADVSIDADFGLENPGQCLVALGLLAD